MAEPVQAPAQLENVEMPRHVGLDIGVGIDQRIAHSRLGGEMEDPLDPLVGIGESLHGAAIGDVEALEGEIPETLEQRQPRLLQVDVVIVVEVVDADDLIAALEQGLGGVKADETGRAGDEKAHILQPVILR